MKNKFVLLFGMLVAVFTSGCVSWNHHNGNGGGNAPSFWTSKRGGGNYFNHTQSANMPIGQTEVDRILPPGPRRSSTSIENWDGSYRYDHDQGTDTRVNKEWDPYYGSRIEMERRTWDRTHESYDPERRYYRRW